MDELTKLSDDLNKASKSLLWKAAGILALGGTAIFLFFMSLARPTINWYGVLLSVVTYLCIRYIFSPDLTKKRNEVVSLHEKLNGELEKFEKENQETNKEESKENDE